MGDMGDLYRDMKELRDQHKREQLDEAERLLGDQFTKLSDHHWRTSIGGYRLDYWPSTGAYRWTNKTQHATPERMVQIIRELRWKEERGARIKP